MNKLGKVLLAFLLCASCASATTTVTGTVQTLGGGNVTTGAFVRFWLRGCGGNQPRVNGVGLIAPTQGGVFYFDLPVNGSGVVSGTLYSTRNSTGLLGGDIECGGNKTSVWYGMQAFTNGKGGPEVAVHAKSGGTLDITSITPITSNPVVTAPTGDITYCRLDGGNGTCPGVGGGNVSSVGTPAIHQVTEWNGPISINGSANFTDSGTVLHYGGAVNPVSIGPSSNNWKFVDGVTAGSTTTGAVADKCENYPTNNGLRTCVIYSPPELITVNPFPPNFSVMWYIMPGSTNSTVSNSSNINSVLTAVPIILNSNSAIVGVAGPVSSGGNFSGGSALVASDTFIPALGVPTGGATITCNGAGAVTAPFIAVRMVNNVQTHPGALPAAGFGAYVKKTGCTGVASIDIAAPTGFNAGAFTPVDFEVGVSATVNGIYYLQVPGSGMTCTVTGTVDANEACKLTGTAHITAVQSLTCSSSCTTPFEMDEVNGTPEDMSNCLLYLGAPRAGGGWSTQSFNTQIRDLTIAAQPTGHGTNQPNNLVCNMSAEENSGTPASQITIYGDAGGYTGVTGAYIYNEPWAPNSNWSHLAVSGGPTSGTNPFWAVIIDGHPTTPPVGGASGGSRQMTDNTLNLRGGASVDGAILIQGNRANVGVSDSHVEILNANDAYVVTGGARATFTHSEAFTGGIALHITATAGPVEVNMFCNQGPNSSNQDRCTPTAISVQDDTTGGGTFKGTINHYTEGTIITQAMKFNPMTFTQITALTTCAAAAEGYEYSITDSTTAVFNANITVGGGAIHVLAYCNGTNWTVH